MLGGVRRAARRCRGHRGAGPGRRTSSPRRTGGCAARRPACTGATARSTAGRPVHHEPLPGDRRRGRGHRSGRAPGGAGRPGVVLHDAVDGLRAFAERASVGVLNTWGAKGVFDWRSPHHLATAGLQARDFELGGLADADLIVDDRPRRARGARPSGELAPVVDVVPSSLAALAERIERRAARDHRAAAPGGAGARHPGGVDRARSGRLPPTKVTQHYSQVLGDGGLVAADPGTAGLLGRPDASRPRTSAASSVTADRDAPGVRGGLRHRGPARRPRPTGARGGRPARRPDVAGARGGGPPRDRRTRRGVGRRRPHPRCRRPRGPTPRARPRRSAGAPSPPTRASSTRCSPSPARSSPGRADPRATSGRLRRATRCPRRG